MAICVGYNSAGVPIINGHTRDVFHQVLSGYTKTIKINTTNRLGTTPAQATTIGTFPKTYTQYLGLPLLEAVRYREHCTKKKKPLRMTVKEWPCIP